MKEKRVGSAAIVLSKAIWITGGFKGANSKNTTEIIFLNGTKKEGPKLPERISEHCSAQYEGLFFLINHGRRVWIFIQAKNEIKLIGEGPSINNGRIRHACSIFQSSQHGGRPVLVVAGGDSWGTGDVKISEFWDFTVPSSKWEQSSKSDFWSNILHKIGIQHYLYFPYSKVSLKQLLRMLCCLLFWYKKQRYFSLL